MLENLKKYRVVLASNSPRRRELLEKLGVTFEVRVQKDIDESYPNTLRGEEVPMFIAGKKAEAYKSNLAADELLITADTVVCLEGQVLGKPADKKEAERMLHSLSGRTHEVITAVSITTHTVQRTFAVTSSVQFAQLEADEIDYYIETYRPYDKAGSYGIQEWIGMIGVEALRGSFFNVMGLPVQRLYRELKKM